MRVHHIRNATLILHLGGQRLLVDPMLGAVGSGIGFHLFRGQYRRNPVVPLPSKAEAVLATVTGAVITHRHPDHLDKAAIRWLRDRKLPVYAHPQDLRALMRQGRRLLAERCNELLGRDTRQERDSRGRRRSRLRLTSHERRRSAGSGRGLVAACPCFVSRDDLVVDRAPRRFGARVQGRIHHPEAPVRRVRLVDDVAAASWLASTGDAFHEKLGCPGTVPGISVLPTPFGAVMCCNGYRSGILSLR